MPIVACAWLTSLLPAHAETPLERAAQPFLYFTDETLPQLRARLEQAPFAERWRLTRRAAERYLRSGPAPVSTSVDLAISRKAAGIIEVCAFAYAVTGERRFARRAQAEVWALLERDAWRERKVWNRGAELFTAECAAACGRFYDWCGHLLSSAERRHFIERARVLALAPYLTSVEGERRDWWVDNYVTNWNGVVHGGCGLLGLALYHELPQARRAAGHAWKHLQRFLDNVILEDGGGHEGVMYHRYGTTYAFRFVTAWHHATGEPFPVDTAARLGGYWDIHLHGPDRRYANFNNMAEHVFRGLWNTGRGRWTGGPSAPLNALYEARTPGGDPLLLWAADHGGGSPYTWEASVDWFLWRRDAPPAGERPALQDNVLFRGAGHAVLSNQRFWLAYNGGWISSKSHYNQDLGHFILVADGVRFLGDPGYGHKHTNAHSTVTIGGKPQPRGAGPGTFQAFATGDDHAFLVSDLSDCYEGRAKCLIRTVVMLSDCIIVLDAIEPDDAQSVDWRLQTRGAIDLLEDGAVLSRQERQLHVVTASPAQPELRTGDTVAGFRHLSLRPDPGGRSADVAAVLAPGPRPEVTWNRRGDTATLTVDGTSHRFERTGRGWLPRLLAGQPIPEPAPPVDRVLKSHAPKAP